MMNMLEVYNQAIGRLGGEQLPVGLDLARDTTGVLCVGLFPHVLNLALSSYNWSFALDRAVLARSGNLSVGEGYAYRYALPAGLVRPVRLVNQAAGQGMGMAQAKGRLNKSPAYVIEGQHLLTNEAPVTLVYVARVTDPARWPGYFTEALVWGLAAELAAARINDTQKQGWATENAKTALERAMLLDRKGSRPSVAVAPSAWNAARFGGGATNNGGAGSNSPAGGA